jgi:hypothetical protein
MDEFVRVLFEEFQDLHKKIFLVGVRFSNLREADAAQESILTYAGSETRGAYRDGHRLALQFSGQFSCIGLNDLRTKIES